MKSRNPVIGTETQALCAVRHFHRPSLTSNVSDYSPALTLTMQSASYPPAIALITAVPAATPVIVPLLTVAIAEFEVPQVIEEPVVFVAVTEAVPPTVTDFVLSESVSLLGSLYADFVAHSNSPFGITCAGIVSAAFCSIPPLPRASGRAQKK